MTKSTITRERLQEMLEWCEVFRRHPRLDDIAEAIRIALAAMDSKPVAWIWQHLDQFNVTIYDEQARDLALGGVNVEPLYRHPQPEPAGVEDDVRNVIGLLGNNEWVDHCTSTELGHRLESEITRLYNWRSSQQEQEVHDDVLEALRKVARIRLDLNNFDGDHRGLAFCLSDAEETLIEVVNRRATMLAAAHQSPGSEPANVPGKWIPVSERMPDEMTAEQAHEVGDYYGDPVDVFARGANWMRQHIIDSTLAAASQGDKK